MRAGLLSLFAFGAVTGEQLKTSVPPYLWEVVSNTTLPSVRSLPKPKSAKAQALRTKENCKFPLDVVIMQDVTDSFSDNIEAMKNTQLDLMYQGITSAHPDTKFAVVSFKDKPITPLGNRDDYCTQFDAPLTSDLAAVKSAYSKLVSYGGADAPENQFGTLVNVLSSNRVNWTVDDVAVKLVVISTDAGMHFEGDSTTGTLPAFNPNTLNDDEMAVCLANYYPSADYVKQVVTNTGAYVASLVYDGQWASGWPSKSWMTFNSFIGQSPEFVASQTPDSSDFWSRLASIVAAIEDIECEDETTTPAPATTAGPTLTTTPAPTTPTTAAPTTTTTTPAPTTTMTSAPLTTTTPAPAPTTSAPISPECSCPCDTCGCCPEVVIKLQHRPNKLSLQLENPSA